MQIWRSWKEGFLDPICIWAPRAPDGYTALGCIAIAAFIEPDIKDVWCAHLSLVEDTHFEDEEIWHTPNNAVWIVSSTRSQLRRLLSWRFGGPN